MKRLRGYTESKGGNKEMIGMTDIIILDTEYTSHNGSKI